MIATLIFSLQSEGFSYKKKIFFYSATQGWSASIILLQWTQPYLLGSKANVGDAARDEGRTK